MYFQLQQVTYFGTKNPFNHNAFEYILFISVEQAYIYLLTMCNMYTVMCVYSAYII